MFDEISYFVTGVGKSDILLCLLCFFSLMNSDLSRLTLSASDSLLPPISPSVNEINFAHGLLSGFIRLFTHLCPAPFAIISLPACLLQSDSRVFSFVLSSGSPWKPFSNREEFVYGSGCLKAIFLDELSTRRFTAHIQDVCSRVNPPENLNPDIGSGLTTVILHLSFGSVLEQDGCLSR